MIDKIMLVEKVIKEIKEFVKHCLLFQSKDVKEWFFGLATWLCIALLSYALYDLFK